MAEKASQRKPGRVSLEQVDERFRSGFEQGDGWRREGLDQMVVVERTKLIQLRRERARMEAKHGRKSERVARLDRQMVAGHQKLVHARMELDRTSKQPPEREERTWTLHGYVRDIDGHPIKGYVVELNTEPTLEGRSVALATTDERGYYVLRAKTGAAVTTAARPRLPLLFLSVRDEANNLVQRESRPVSLTPRGLTYRDVLVKKVTRRGFENFPGRFLGNARSRLLHDVRNEKAACQLGEIVVARRVLFHSAKVAARAGYVRCTHCIGGGSEPQ